MESVGAPSPCVSDMRDPDTLAVTAETWTDYDAEEYYADWELDGGVPTETMQYLAGVFQMEPGGAFGFQLSAFGPRGILLARATRYGYAGAHGYEEGLMPDLFSMGVFPYLHVGARWYDPATGRFLERDPIGIDGELNVYEYIRSRPLTAIDPTGNVIYPNTFTNKDLGRDKPLPPCPHAAPGEKRDLTPEGFQVRPKVQSAPPRSFWQKAGGVAKGIAGFFVEAARCIKTTFVVMPDFMVPDLHPQPPIIWN